MSFGTEVYPYRNNRGEFTRRLLNKLIEWQHVVSIGWAPGASRAVQFMEKTRCEALLKAWRGDFTDRYLEREQVTNFADRSYIGVGNAEQVIFEQIRQNAPQGAVKFIADELEHCRDYPVFGSSLREGYNYDSFFSTLLHWDEIHCYGLISEINAKLANAAPHPVYIAASNWIGYQAQHRVGIYAQYNIQWEHQINSYLRR